MKCQPAWSSSWNLIAGRNIINLRYADTTTLMAESVDELVSWLKRIVKKLAWHSTFKKLKIIASSSITSWQIDGETVADFILGDSKITADGDCSHKIKKCLLLGRKAMTNLDSILKSRDITLPTKVHLVKAMVFPVVMYGWELDHKESWALEELMLLKCGVEKEFFHLSYRRCDFCWKGRQKLGWENQCYLTWGQCKRCQLSGFDLNLSLG